MTKRRVVKQHRTFPEILADYVIPAGIDDCWPWNGSINSCGYGVTTLRGRQLRGHRIAYEVAKGPIPDGLLVRHTCDNRPCCNPKHLLVGTALDNSRDAVERDRRPRGEKQWMSVLTESDGQEIRRRRLARETLQSIADDFGISDTHVGHIASGKSWRRSAA